jgi:hypothetical protein
MENVLKIISRRIKELEVRIADEKLSGNIVKETHAQGGRAELVAIECIIRAEGAAEKGECEKPIRQHEDCDGKKSGLEVCGFRNKNGTCCLDMCNP